MKRYSLGKSRILAAALGLAGCTTATTPANNAGPALILSVENPTYSVNAGAPYVNFIFGLRIDNESDNNAQLGCGLDIERETGGKFETVVFSACSGAASNSPMIPAHTSTVVSFTRSIETTLFDETKKYRIATAVAFGPDFKLGLPYKSIPFTVARQR